LEKQSSSAYAEYEEPRIADEWITFGFICRGSLDAFIEASEILEELCLVVYRTKSADKLWIVKEGAPGRGEVRGRSG
jgi:hypothetical protein